jgi:hypothetical protein
MTTGISGSYPWNLWPDTGGIIEDNYMLRMGRFKSVDVEV